MKEIITELLQRDNQMDFSKKPTVVLVIGVTALVRQHLSASWQISTKIGNRVLLAGGDTFRAAAASQLTEWANRAGVDIVKHGEGADPAAVIFEAVEKQREMAMI